MQHISSWQHRLCKKVCIVGKGASYMFYKGCQADEYISLNSVIEKVRRGILIQMDPGHEFELSMGVTVVAPKQVCEIYTACSSVVNFGWDDIPKRCSAITAVHVAHMIGAEEILMCGFDNLVGDASYHGDFKPDCPASQWQWGLKQQIVMFQELPSYLKNKVTLLPWHRGISTL